MGALTGRSDAELQLSHHSGREDVKMCEVWVRGDVKYVRGEEAEM